MSFYGIVCLVVCAAPTVSSAQTEAIREWPIAAGARVRVVSPVLGSERQTGSVVVATPDTLVFRSAKASTSTAIATPSIVKLEVTQGKHSNKRKGALIGLGVGVVAGAIIGYATHDSGCKDPNTACFAIDFGPDGDAALGAGLFGIVGLVFGTLAGMHQSDTWVPVAVPHQ